MALGATLPRDIHEDSRVELLSGNARALYYDSFSYCHSRERDRLSHVDVQKLRGTRAAVRELLERGLWVEQDGAMVVYGYLEHNTARADAEAAREQARVRMRSHRSRERRHERSSEPCSERAGEQEANVANSLPLASPSSLSLDLNPNSEHSSALSSSSEDCSGDARVSEKPAKQRRKTGMPVDFSPTSEHHERARKYGLNVTQELEKFRLYHESKGTLSASWNASFTTWLIQGAEFRERNGKAPGFTAHEERSGVRGGAYPLFRDQGRVPEGERIAPAELKGLLSSVGKRIG